MTELRGQRRKKWLTRVICKRFLPGGTENPAGLQPSRAQSGLRHLEVGEEEKTYLLCSAQPHPHLEPPEEQLHHLIVLEIHSWTVQLCSCTLVIPQQHGYHQPQEDQPKEGKTGVENQRGDGVRRPGSGPAWAPCQQSASTGAHQGQASGGHTAVAIDHRVKKLNGWEIRDTRTSIKHQQKEENQKGRARGEREGTGLTRCPAWE